MIRTLLVPAFVLAWMAPAAPQEAAPQDGQQSVAKEFLKPGDNRTFSITYTGRVLEIPAETKKLRLWLPVPQDSTVQAIRDLKFSRDMKSSTENKYGDKIAYAEIESPGATAEVTMSFVCTRSEIRIDLEKLAGEGSDPAGSYGVFRGPDALVTVDDEIRKLAGEVTQGKKDTVAKARAIYDYVLQKMTYDKSGKGWGTGSTKFACEVGKGNCTDFHALFNSLCRAEGIASGFEIGLYLPYEKKKEDKLGGYHCCALFRVPGQAWVPVHCSDADRFPDRKETLF